MSNPIQPDNSCVICPGCAHQFRAIPVDVQRLMLDAGFEPPFTSPATPDRSGAPISEDRIDAAAAFWTDDECFRQGVYWAETKHGIRGEGE